MTIAETAVPATVLEHDTAAAVDFLRGRVPDGLVALAAKRPDRGGMEGRTFAMPGEVVELADWIDARQGRRNLYWMPNEPRATAPRDRRCDAAAIRVVRAIGIDSDPDDDEGGAEQGAHGSDGWQRGQTRLDRIVDSLQQSAAPPTVIVRSGYGRQALWWFEHPFDLDALDADTRKAVVHSVQSQAQGLEQLYASDGVHDLCRVLRLPFTVNLPDAGKQARGRLPSSATVLDLDPTRLHSLDALAAVAAPIAADKEAGAVDPHGLQDALSHLGMPDSLPAPLRAAVDAELRRGKAFHTAVNLDVVQGRRSTRDRALVCASVEAGWSDLEIACVFCAYSSGKIEDKMERGDGAALAHISGEIARARAKTAPNPPFDPTSWLDHEAMARAATAEADRIRERAQQFVFVTLDEAAAAADTDAAAPLVKGLLDQGAASVLYGASNVGKSFVAFSLAYAIATGRPWGVLKTTRMRTLIVAAEGSRGARKRAKALFQRFGSCPDFLLLLSSVNLFRADADLEPLIQAVLAAGGIGFLVLDTLARVMVGGDENQTRDMTTFVEHIARLQAATGAHVMLVHHSGKNEANGARGSGALKAAVDTEIEIKSDTVKVTKQRDMDKDWSAPFRLEVVPLGVDRDGDPVTSCVVHIEQVGEAVPAAAAAEDAARIVLTKSERDIVDVMIALDATRSKPARPVNIADLLEGADRSRDKLESIRTHLKALRRKGSVDSVGRGQWAIRGPDSLSKSSLGLLETFG